VDGSTRNFSFETTNVGGDSAEFFGIFRNNMPLIKMVAFDASGDGLWGSTTLSTAAQCGSSRTGYFIAISAGLIVTKLKKIDKN
jgi:hypothetical protein